MEAIKGWDWGAELANHYDMAGHGAKAEELLRAAERAKWTSRIEVAKIAK